MTRPLRWTEHAVTQLATIADYVSVSSPVYAEALVERIVLRLEQAQHFPESGGRPPESTDPAVRQLIEWPYRLIYRVHTEAIEVLSIVHGRQELSDIPGG